MPISKKEFELFKNVIERLNEQNQSYNTIGNVVIFIIAGGVMLWGLQKLYCLLRKPKKLNSCIRISNFLFLMTLLLPYMWTFLAVYFGVHRNAMQLLILVCMVIRLFIEIIRLKISAGEDSTGSFCASFIIHYMYHKVSCVDKNILYGNIILFILYLVSIYYYSNKRNDINEKNRKISHMDKR